MSMFGNCHRCFTAISPHNGGRRKCDARLFVHRFLRSCDISVLFELERPQHPKILNMRYQIKMPSCKGIKVFWLLALMPGIIGNISWGADYQLEGIFTIQEGHDLY